MAKNPLTLEEHRNLGLELARTQDRLVELSVDLANRYGKNSKISTRSKAAHTRLSELRSLLEEELFKEHPDLDRQGVEVYYPRAETTATNRRPPRAHAGRSHVRLGPEGRGADVVLDCDQ